MPHELSIILFHLESRIYNNENLVKGVDTACLWKLFICSKFPLYGDRLSEKIIQVG